jgi:hypothetical protein
MSTIATIGLGLLGVFALVLAYQAGTMSRRPPGPLGGGSSPYGGMAEFRTLGGEKVRLEWRLIDDATGREKSFTDVGDKTAAQAKAHTDGAAAIDLLVSRGYPDVVISFAGGGQHRSMWTGGLGMRSLWSYADKALSEVEELGVDTATVRQASPTVVGVSGGRGGGNQEGGGAQ